ncbi:hypothetical protein [Streptomyces sp. NPDC047315]|uniref:hypothetical protein n=1 Tax=Streptomyces sp. NPDC047315 TaxID=3155142 RepID=UPI0033C791CF
MTSTTGAAIVTGSDINAVAKLDPRRAMYRLFEAPDSRLIAHMNSRDHAAVCAVLTWSRNWDSGEERLLRVLHAVGRGSLRLGAVHLAGEVASRCLHRHLVRQHGPYGLEPLTAAITTLWPLPGERSPHVDRHPAGALHRLTSGPLKDLLKPSDIQALLLLARALPDGGGDKERKLTALARMCEVLARTGRLDRDDLTAVRDQILDARTSAQRRPDVEQGPHDDQLPP